MTIKRIFALYLDEKTVPALLERLSAEAIKTARRYSTKGNHYGDREFTRGHLYKLLSNPIYVGRVPHKATSHRGQHAPIIDTDVWEAVQQQLAANTQGRRQRRHTKNGAWILEGLLRSEAGNPLTPSHSRKGTRRYRYYVEQLAPGAGTSPIRLPAREIEAAVKRGLLAYLGDHRTILAQYANLPAARKQGIVPALARLCCEIEKSTSGALRHEFLRLLRAAEYRHNRLLLELDERGLLQALTGSATSDDTGSNHESVSLTTTVPLIHRRRGPQMKLTVSGREADAQLDRPLITAIVRAWHWADRLARGEVSSMAEICAAESFSDTYVGQLLPLAFLSPKIVEDILAGRQESSLTADRLIWDTPIPVDWGEQADV